MLKYNNITMINDKKGINNDHDFTYLIHLWYSPINKDFWIGKVNIFCMKAKLKKKVVEVILNGY